MARRKGKTTDLSKKTAGKIKRKEELIYDVKLNLLLINCRSIKTKFPSLIENMKTNHAETAILTETWLHKNDKQVKKEIGEMFDEHSFSVI